MLANFPPVSNKFLLLLFAGLVLAIMVVAGLYRYGQQKSENPYKIGVIITSAELPAGQMHILKAIIAQRLKLINDKGGLKGHPLEVIYLNDQNNDKILYSLVQQTSQDPNLIAYVGGRGLSRAKTIGPILTRKKIPFIGLYVFTHLLQEFPTMYTASVGVKEGKMVVGELLKSKARRIGFIGEKDAITSTVFQQIIEKIVAENPELEITFKRSFPVGFIHNAKRQQAFADSIKNNTDLIVWLSNPASCNSFLNFMNQQNIKIPIFLATPDMPLLDSNSEGYRTAEILYINMFGIPGAQNTRWMEQIGMVVEEGKNYEETVANLSVAGRIADEIGLLHEAAEYRSPRKDLSIREQINEGLKQYIKGNRVYRGWLTDWYFTPEHAYAGETLVAWKPRNQTVGVLAPYQYLRSDSGLFKRQVLYTTLNLVDVSQISDDEGTFYASFYLNINSTENVDIKTIDFTNAARNEINHNPLIEIRQIRAQKDSSGFQFYNNLYKISGKFFFEPDLKNYPLDQQKFPISIQAANPAQVFLVQPAQKEVRDTLFESKGWLYKNQFMGYEQDIISSVNNFRGQKKNIPYYKFSYMYVLKRAPVDFFLKTLVPLMAIIIISYFSVYIPPREFEALAGIQVTGLLSSIALYFSTYKPEMQYATISDKIFIFTYVMITALLGTSILLYVLHHKNTAITRMMRLFQRYVFPVIVLGFTVYIRWF